MFLIFREVYKDGNDFYHAVAVIKKVKIVTIALEV
jgi:hypothetical protein